MEKRRGRPLKGSAQAKAELLQVRLDTAERRAFKEAAELAGIDLSAWVRERLRWAATRELEAMARPVAFLPVRDNA